MSFESSASPDEPIHDVSQDELSRAPTAEQFAYHILNLDSSKGLVLGVMGAWGSGKTSFVNLMRPKLAEKTEAIIDFNPWMFSGVDQLAGHFFGELSSQLGESESKTLKSIGENLKKYGKRAGALDWVPVVGPWLGRVANISEWFTKNDTDSLALKRDNLSEQLEKLQRPIIVVIDDIDRLRTGEIRDLFRLVRLTASFPNIVYLLCFDRVRVESALSEDRLPGRAYLEKILFVSIDLPVVPDTVLRTNFLKSLNTAIGDTDQYGPFDKDRWADIYAEIIAPLVRTMRDTRRYIATVQGTLPMLGQHISLEDALALEAVRVFLPDTHTRIHGLREELTSTSESRCSAIPREERTATLESWIDSEEQHSDVVRSMVNRLFPAAEGYLGGLGHGSDWLTTWMRSRLVAHPDVLAFYLENTLGASLSAFNLAEQAVRFMDTEDRFRAFIQDVPSDRLEEVIGELEHFTRELSVQQAHSAVPVLCELLSEIHNRRSASVFLGGRDTLLIIVKQMLRRFPDTNAVDAFIPEVMEHLNSFSAKYDLLHKIAFDPGTTDNLISEEADHDLLDQWVRDFCDQMGNLDLTKEYDLFCILMEARKEIERLGCTLVLPEEPAFSATVLSSAVSEGSSHTMGNRAVTVTKSFPWDELQELFGGEERWAHRVESLKDSGTEIDPEILELANKYADGWRPER